jgi:hypothetical protein
MPVCFSPLTLTVIIFLALSGGACCCLVTLALFAAGAREDRP